MATSKNKAAKSSGNVSDAPGAKVQPSYAEEQGTGGETHQMAGGEVATLTTAQGGPIADDQNTLRYGARGPALIDDFHFREKVFHFDMSASPSGSFMRAAMAPTAISN